MQAQVVVRSPLAMCVDHLQQTAGPAASSENAVALATKLHGDQSTLQACAQIILRDLGLTLRLLRIANSAMFNSGGKTVISVTHASALLGTDALAQLVDTVPRHNLAHPVKELVVLSHLTAVIARSLVLRVEPRYSEEAFIAGLFRNIGELCYAGDMPDDYRHVLVGSLGTMTGLRASCQKHAHFDFDELSADLLFHWSLHGSPVKAVQSTPEALYAQHGSQTEDVALAASIAHHIASAYLRCDAVEREKIMRPCWGPLVKQYQMREAQVETVVRLGLESIEGLMGRLDVTVGGLRLKEWIPAEVVEVKASDPIVVLSGSTPLRGLLETAIAKGMDRAAWLSFNEPNVALGDIAGSGWPPGAAAELPQLVNPRKPPFLLAFGQRQDVWIDMAKDHRFKESPLALTMKPSAYFLLPVLDGKRVRGCLYFDWANKRDFSPETLLPALAALRDYMATNMPAV